MNNRKMIASICPRHGFTTGDHCEKCSSEKPKDTLQINTGEWVNGWYEHIDPKGPIYIESKAHLRHECAKRGLLAKSLMKPKSQGAGYEMR